VDVQQCGCAGVPVLFRVRHAVVGPRVRDKVRASLS